jgi:hypothetical protein
VVVFSRALVIEAPLAVGAVVLIFDAAEWLIIAAGRGIVVKAEALVAVVGAVVAVDTVNEPVKDKGSILPYHLGRLVEKLFIICIIPTAKSSVLSPVRYIHSICRAVV